MKKNNYSNNITSNDENKLIKALERTRKPLELDKVYILNNKTLNFLLYTPGSDKSKKKVVKNK